MRGRRSDHPRDTQCRLTEEPRVTSILQRYHRPHQKEMVTVLGRILGACPRPVTRTCNGICQTGSGPRRLSRVFHYTRIAAHCLSTLTVTSFTTHRSSAIPPPRNFTRFSNGLSFNGFLAIIRTIAGLTAGRPLRTPFSRDLVTGADPTGNGLRILLRLHGRFNRDLRKLDSTTTAAYLRHSGPLRRLRRLLRNVRPLTGRPLFIISTRGLVHGIPAIIQLILVNRRDSPIPGRIPIARPFVSRGQLCLNAHRKTLILRPVLI